MKLRVLGRAALGVCVAGASMAGLLAGCGNQPVTIGEDAAAAPEEKVGSASESLVATTSLVISDGKAVAPLRSILGGGVKAPVVVEGAGFDGVAGKHLGPVAYDSVTIPITSSMPKSYFDWASDGLKGSFSSKTLEVSNCDFNGNELYSRTFSDSALVSLVFPTLDASSTDNVPLFSEKLSPTATVSAKGSGKCAAAPVRTKTFIASKYRVQLEGLDASRISKIDAFEVKRGVKDRTFTIPNLRIYINEAGVDDFREWFRSFVINGNNHDDKELSGAIQFMSTDFKSEMLSLDLNGVGISRLSDGDDEKEGTVPANTWVADLYVEQMSLRVGSL